jgi:hypothetical protein
VNAVTHQLGTKGTLLMAKRKAKRKSITERLELLERQAAEVRVRTIEAGEFRLVDQAGRMRALMQVTRIGPRLVMMHEDGTVAVEIKLGHDGPAVRLADDKGSTRVFVGAMRGMARIGMADAEGLQRLLVGLSHTGEPSVTLYDDSHQRVWRAEATKVRPSGKSRKSRASAK